jgi:hypothetical protein
MPYQRHHEPGPCMVGCSTVSLGTTVTRMGGDAGFPAKAAPTRATQIATCGEAYHRYTTCREIERDGGVMAERNGIPCLNVCGNTPLAMVAKIRSEPPFSPPLKILNTC